MTQKKPALKAMLPCGMRTLYHAPWNLHHKYAIDRARALVYFDRMDRNCIMCYLDDDDQYLDPLAFAKMNGAAQADAAFMLFWRVKFPHRLVPIDANFGQPPVCGDISTIGFAHSFDLSVAHGWDEYSFGDYRTAEAMYRYAKHKYLIDEPLTGLQRKTANGFGRGDDK
jgi:hypothetical protein